MRRVETRRNKHSRLYEARPERIKLLQVICPVPVLDALNVGRELDENGAEQLILTNWRPRCLNSEADREIFKLIKTWELKRVFEASCFRPFSIRYR